MRWMIIAATVMLSACAAAPDAALSIEAIKPVPRQLACRDAASFDLLAADLGLHVGWAALDGTGNPVEIYIDENGKWAAYVWLSGSACLLASGSGWKIERVRI